MRYASYSFFLLGIIDIFREKAELAILSLVMACAIRLFFPDCYSQQQPSTEKP